MEKVFDSYEKAVAYKDRDYSHWELSIFCVEVE